MILQLISFDLKKIHEFWNNSMGIHFVVICAFMLLNSCIDESFESKAEGAFINISLANNVITAESRVDLNPGDDIDGIGMDNVVRKLRILVFDNNGDLAVDPDIPNIGNKLYSIINTSMDVVSHPVKVGTGYTLVFIANEPAVATTDLEAIQTLAALKQITFPASAFDDNELIPMLQVITNADISQDTGTSAKVRFNYVNGTREDINGKIRDGGAPGLYDSGDEANPLVLRLDRLAVRIRVLLKSEFNLEDTFDGISLTNLPDVVPLFQSSYNTETMTYNTKREYEVGSFADNTTETSEKIIWEKELSRIVIPSSHFTAKNDPDKAVIFTAKLKGKYSPFCELKIEDDNYNLPYNTWLDFTGTIKNLIEVNIKPQDWSEVLNNWQISGSRILNVSQTSASITDFNGVRISFYSNMPRVRVTKVTKDGTNMDINTAFNDLADPVLITEDGHLKYKTSRFSYNTVSGSGYLDVISDGGNAGNTLAAADITGTYILTLSADDGSGGSILQREIKIKVTQYGVRFTQLPWIHTYRGIFYRDTEYGERIVTGQYHKNLLWGASTNDSWIVLSMTPSFDPAVGTDNPGKAEDYPVTGKTDVVSGKGRIYFRVGLTGENPDKGVLNRYGSIQLWYYPEPSNTEWRETITIYVRQGETADYVYEKNQPVDTYTDTYKDENGVVKPKVDISYQPLANSNRGTTPVRISPYNLTAPQFKKGGDAVYYQVDVGKGEFVDYPSQGGAYFQWALDYDRTVVDYYYDNGAQIPISPVYPTKYWRAAYNPVSSKIPTNVLIWGGDWVNTNWVFQDHSWELMWNPDTGDSAYPYNYGKNFETCPGEYRRPTDGPTNEISYNGPYPKPSNEAVVDFASFIRQSELRLSLFKYPFSGDANEVSDMDDILSATPKYQGTYPPKGGREEVPGTANSFYADGFFDRRPINAVWQDGNQIGYAVSADNTNIAYPGLLFFNETSKASVFFPGTGRIASDWPAWSFKGVTGYYMSSSAGPYYADADIYGRYVIGNGTWVLETQYYGLVLKSTYPDSGMAIRCVKD